MHEEVHIDRRPAQAGAGTSAHIGKDEITIPVMGEKVVVEKRVVPVEEIVNSKSAVRDTQTVEADLKHETIDVDRKGRTGESARGRE